MHIKPGLFIFVIGMGFVLLSCQQQNSSQATAVLPADSPAVQSHEQVIVENPPVPADSTYLLGVWYDEGIKAPDGAKIAYEVIATKNRVFIQPLTFKGEDLKVSDTPVVSAAASELQKNGNRYVSLDSPEDQYEVDKAGNLLIYHHEELIVTCKKIL